MSMLFTINDSPFFGKEGKFVTSRHIQDRLTKELDKNLALRVRKSELEDGKWIVSGRGVLHLSVLIETMRREGYNYKWASLGYLQRNRRSKMRTYRRINDQRTRRIFQ